MLLPLSFTVPLTILSLIALIINITVLFIVVLCKQVSPSNILLFHLGIIESLLCIVFLVFSVPILTNPVENFSTICKLDAFFLTILHPIAVWTVCGLNCDRYFAISAPLHYNAIVSSRKVICGLACGWLIAIIGATVPLFDVAPYHMYKDVGICGPNFSSENSLWYAITFSMCTFIIPGSLIILCNVKVFMIARYHRHRIAGAIFQVTLSAQVTITHQRNPFPLPFEAIPPKLRARSPMTSVFQIVGSFLLLYCPYYVTILWHSSLSSIFNWNIPKNMEIPLSVIVLSFMLMHSTVFVNIIIYGLKSKVLRKSVKNYWRKKKTKHEINNEIQARTPSTCGSRRPSLNALNFGRSISHRRLSETYVNLTQMGNGSQRPHMKRIASELCWQPLTRNSPVELLPHASSANTLQIPHNDIAEDDGKIELHDTIQTRLNSVNDKSLSTTSLNSHSNANYEKLTTTYIQNTCKEVRRYLQIGTRKVFRIELNDSYKRKEPVSPLRSPQILITSTYSDDSTDVQSSPIVKSKHDNLFTESLFEQKNNQTIDFEIKSDDSDDNLPINEFYSNNAKRCLSLDEPELTKYKIPNSAGDIEEPLLLSWPTTRKKYKHEPNMNQLFTDRCDEPEVVL
ncbi:uncharacterized protein LOC116347014 [Contarinia nasturtii]|uniref:uncharacterized protein LOC116347014 n=1 Tax=Contarinia nasturtii TaxID=265458 RepID=UPI0012D39DBC|nr:uncharacterized protein LOC116347014 [Contarinia nasturtii]XP_031633245.1 uncharacterized protein LOC116347014 [Contarinia nasturtii]